MGAAKMEWAIPLALACKKILSVIMPVISQSTLESCFELTMQMIGAEATVLKLTFPSGPPKSNIRISGGSSNEAGNGITEKPSFIEVLLFLSHDANSRRNALLC